MTETTTRIAIPSCAPGGMTAATSAHFGHCDCFTLVDIAEETVSEAAVVHNPPHTSCLGPVNLLVDNGVNAILVQGIGRRPLLGFRDVGIAVYGGQAATVAELAQAYATGTLQLLTDDMVCGGGGHAH